MGGGWAAGSVGTGVAESVGTTPVGAGVDGSVGVGSVGTGVVESVGAVSVGTGLQPPSRLPGVGYPAVHGSHRAEE